MRHLIDIVYIFQIRPDFRDIILGYLSKRLIKSNYPPKNFINQTKYFTFVSPFRYISKSLSDSIRIYLCINRFYISETIHCQ